MYVCFFFLLHFTQLVQLQIILFSKCLKLTYFHFPTLMAVLHCRGHQELQTVSAAIQTVLSTPVSVATALKGIQKTLGKALPFKVWRHLTSFTSSSDIVFEDIYSSSDVVLPSIFHSFLSCIIKEKKVFKSQSGIMSLIHNYLYDDLNHFTNHIHRLHQLESVAECASRLRLLSKALDVSDLRLDGATGPWRQELVRLQGAGLGLDIKESLLEAFGLVLLANNQLDSQKSGKLLSDRALTCVPSV